jgi:hypothetical protein
VRFTFRGETPGEGRSILGGGESDTATIYHDGARAAYSRGVIRLTTGTLGRLRDRLRERGARPSVVLAGTPDTMLAAELAETYGPLCEVMYAMMTVDEEVAPAERDVVRGALRDLDERILSVHVEAMLADAAHRIASEGRDARMRAIAAELAGEPTRAEAAFLLAAAVAYADDRIVQGEKALLNDLATQFAIAPARANELFDSLESVDELLGRAPAADAMDTMLHAASRVVAPEDFERLAAMTNRTGVRIALRLYATFARSAEHMRDRGGTPTSLSHARAAAMMALAESIPDDVSPRASEVHAALGWVAQALTEVDAATSLAAIAGNETSMLATLERATKKLVGIVIDARRRCGEDVKDADVGALGDLVRVAASTARGDGAARAQLFGAIDAASRALATALPSALAETIALVLHRLTDLAAGAAPPAIAPELPAWLPQKRTLGGFYVLRQLGHGGTATVFVATRSDERDDPNAERFALKIPAYDAATARNVSEAEFLRMFREEAGALLAMPEHANIARFITFDAGARPKPVLVMELVEGLSCDEAIASRAMTTSRAFEVMDGVLAGLEAMHAAGIGHLDVKPSNVILRGGVAPVIVDFGLAGRKLRPGCATGAYGAPEIWGDVPEGAAPTPMAADVYAFACFAFELLTSRVLIEAPTLTALALAHAAHDGRPQHFARIAADPRTASTAAALAPCLRRDFRQRPDAASVRRVLRGIAPTVATMPWPWPA